METMFLILFAMVAIILAYHEYRLQRVKKVERELKTKTDILEIKIIQEGIKRTDDILFDRGKIDTLFDWSINHQKEMNDKEMKKRLEK